MSLGQNEVETTLPRGLDIGKIDTCPVRLEWLGKMLAVNHTWEQRWLARMVGASVSVGTFGICNPLLLLLLAALGTLAAGVRSLVPLHSPTWPMAMRPPRNGLMDCN